MGLFSRTADVPELTAKRDFEGLVKALKDDDTRDDAMKAIVELKDPAAVPPVVKLSGKVFAGPSSNNAAGETLQKLGPEIAVPPLLELIEGRDEVMVATTALVGFGEEVALKPLIKLRGHEYAYAARRAYMGLLELGTPKAIAAVAEGLEGGPNQLQALLAAKESWEGAEPEMIRACVAPWRVPPEEVKEERIEAVGELLDGLAKRIREGEVDSDEPVATLVGLLDDPVDGVRLMAAATLNLVLPGKDQGPEEPDPRIADALHRACSDSYDRVRLRAAEALARQDDPRALGHLVKLLDAERDEVAVEAAGCINIIAARGPLPAAEYKRILAKYDAAGATSKMAQKLSRTKHLMKQHDKAAA